MKKELGAIDKRLESDREYYRQVCDVFQMRTRCDLCYTGRTEVVQASKGTNRSTWTALCRHCAEAASKVKTATRTTLAQMNKRLKELEAKR